MSDVTALLAEADWLTRLARSLVGSDDADDIVQETYAAALRTPPDPDRPARPWLRRVMVNVVRMRHRGRVRRDAREQASETREPVRTPEQLLERARVERTLADLVIELPEPLRSTVLLRYREGLGAERIAEQQGVSVATVRRRLTDALERLRKGMDKDDTSKTWRAAFAPFLVPRSTERAPWWSMVMAKAGTKIAVIAIAALLLLVGGGLFVRSKHTGASITTAEHRDSAAATVTIDRHARVFAQPGIGMQQVAGRVTYHDQPFVGATVHVSHAITREQLAETTSGPDGTFVLPNLPPAAVVVTAAAADKIASPMIIDLRSPTSRGKRIELRLEGCIHVRGIVSDGSGTPIAHAHVAPDLGQIPFTETDELGRYDLCTHLGYERIRYAASGYHAIRIDLRIVQDFIRDVTLLPEAIVAGTVLDAAGMPAADAAVTIDPLGKSGVVLAPVFTRTNADGTFRLTGVAPGRSQIFAEAVGQASRHVDIVVGAGETRENVVLHLAPAPQLSGRVVDTHHQPLVGVSVGLRAANDEHDGLAITQADGSFVIDRAPKGVLGVVVAHHNVIAPREVTLRDKSLVVEIQAEPFPEITGTVTKGGAPAADALVQCPFDEDFGTHPVTGPSGTFSCPIDREGPLNTCANDGTGSFGCVAITWTRGQELHPITVEMDQAGSICGTVSDETGAHLRGIRVTANDPHADDTGEDTSDDAGHFCIRSMRNEGTYEISTWLGSQEIKPVSPVPHVTIVKGNATPIAIVLAAPDKQIAGNVVDDTGAPVPDAAVKVTADKYFANGLDVAVTDANGHFAIQRLAPGTYQISATARDGSARVMPGITAGTKDVTIKLDRSGSIEGTLVGFNSEPAIIAAPRSDGQEPISLEIDGDHFRAHGVPADTYQLTAVTNGHEADHKSVTVSPGGIGTIVLTSRGTANLTVHVIDFLSKKPVAGARCTTPLPGDGTHLGPVYGSPGDDQPTDATGTAHFTDVTAGQVWMICQVTGTFALGQGTIQPKTEAVIDVYTVAPKSGGGDIGVIHIADRTMATVTPNAAKAGLQVNDLIRAVDGASVDVLDGHAINSLVSTHAVGTQISLTVQRGDATLTLDVTL
ncbi:MAG: sigma-70 family RNA polymerase sigma factor [Kofleriaceae bacterium]